MKKIVLTLALLFVVMILSAQTKNKASISFGGDVGLPLSKAISEKAFGISGKLELPITASLKYTFTPGYVWQSMKQLNYLSCAGCQPPVSVSEDFVSLKTGLRYYYLPLFFAEAEAGGAFKVASEVGNTFLYSLGVGSSLPLNGNGFFDMGLRLENAAKIRYQTSNPFMGQLGVRLAYKYQF